MSQPLIRAADWATINKIVAAAANGPFFDDGEFDTLFGVSREYMREVAQAWPAPNDQNHNLVVAINNAFLHLITYPHGKEALLKPLVGLSSEELGHLYATWKLSTAGSLPGSYLSALE